MKSVWKHSWLQLDKWLRHTFHVTVKIEAAPPHPRAVLVKVHIWVSYLGIMLLSGVIVSILLSTVLRSSMVSGSWNDIKLAVKHLSVEQFCISVSSSGGCHWFTCSSLQGFRIVDLTVPKGTGWFVYWVSQTYTKAFYFKKFRICKGYKGNQFYLVEYMGSVCLHKT